VRWNAAVFFTVLLVMTGVERTFAADPVKLPVPEIETMPNGLTVAWFVNQSLPVIDIAILFKSGYRDDPPLKSGTTELVASTLDRGAAGMSAQEIARAIETLGASRFASPDEDTLTVGMHGLAPDAGTLLELLSKVVLHPDFVEAEVTRSHDLLLDRWSHLPDYGESLAALAFRRILTADTVYGRGSFLRSEEFKKVGRADVLAYHKTHFTPKNAVLMVVGRVDKAAFREKILSVFGSLQAWTGEAPSHSGTKYSDARISRKSGQIIIIDRPNLTQAQVRMGFRAPLIDSSDHYPLVVANALLGEYFNSRLNALLRDKLGLTYGISSGFSYAKEFANLTIGSATRNETVGDVIRETLNVLDGLKKGSISQEEVSMAREYLQGGFPLSASTLGAVALRWLSGYIFNLGPEYLNEFIPKVGAVTVVDVAAAVKRHFDLSGTVIVVSGNAAEIERSLIKAKLGPFKRVLVRDLM
jgi:zinc protease